MGLTLEDLLFNRASGDEAVDEAVLGLAVTPDTGERLLIGGRVPIGIEEDKAVGANQVQTAATSLG